MLPKYLLTSFDATARVGTYSGHLEIHMLVSARVITSLSARNESKKIVKLVHSEGGDDMCSYFECSVPTIACTFIRFDDPVRRGLREKIQFERKNHNKRGY
jgi:hypothetical protein